MNRADLLKTGALALGVALVGDIHQAQARTAAVQSWPHSLTNLVQDDRASAYGASHTHWDAPHQDFQIDYCWRWLAGAGKGTLGWLVFREQDAKNFLQLEHRTSGIALVQRVAGVFKDMAFLARPITVGGDFMFRLRMVGQVATVQDLAADGSAGPVILTATTPLYPAGVNFSYYTNGVFGCWEFARGTVL